MNKMLVATAVAAVGFGVLVLTDRNDTSSTQYDTSTGYSGEDSTVGVGEAEGAVSNASNETMRTLIRKNKSLEETVEKVRKELDEVKSTPVDVVATVPPEFKRQLDEMKQKQAQLEQALEEAKGRPVGEVKPEYVPESPPTKITNVGDGSNDLFADLVPNLISPNFNVGGKSDTKSSSSSNTGANYSDLLGSGLPESRNGMVWFDQGDVVYSMDANKQPVKSYPKSFNANLTGSASGELAVGDSNDSGANSSDKSEKKAKAIPMYTIPSNSTLLGAVGTTAIVGRVPMSGTLSSPYRFKVMLGAKNLATNGHYIPNLKNMVVSGIAQGDFTMECVSGVIDSATFTFQDGTIREVRSEGVTEGGLVSQSTGLGWISDQAGVPCIEGKYISNAKEYVATVGGLSTVKSIANALSDAETTTFADAEGTTSIVSGDTLKYGLSQGVGDGVGEITEFFKERQESAFDAVFLPVGEKLTVHIEHALEIDYEPDGRKISYQQKSKVEDYMQW